MNPAQLLAHFDRISEAPDAIPLLRRFILDLAVRGKLVEQDPSDEPAAELLKQIQAEKIRLAKEGVIKIGKSLPSIKEKEIPFSVPSSWGWVRLGEIGLTQTGTTPSKNIGEHFGNHIPFIKPGDLYTNRVDYSNEGLSEAGLKDSGRIAPAGSLLMVCIGTIGKCQLIDRDCSFNQQINSLTPYGKLSSRYLLTACLTEYFQNSAWAASARTTISILSKGKWELLVLPLPPLAEQHRIVAKVDELMALCDQLEAAKAERESQRDRLIAASLHRLNSSADANTSCKHARFYLNHLPRLTTRPEHIKQLRQTILNLAVRGRLVPQDPNDEPAGELMKRIQKEKVQLIKEKKLRQRDIQPIISVDDAPFPIPKNWEWARLETVCFLITDGAHHTPKYENSGIPFLSVKDVSSGSIDFSNTRFISREAHLELCKRCKPEFGDILLTKVGTTGIAVTVDLDREFSIFVSLALLKFSQVNLDHQYLRILINSPFVRQQSADNTQGIGNKNLVLRLINQFSIPLPPLAEQHRIVAKVDELMALCDQLEAQLTTTQADSRRLLEAMLHRALGEHI